MNHVSIFEKRWLELVFEGRNKNYSAYRLRLENQRTTVFALFLALLLMTTAVVVPVAISKLFREKVSIPPIIDIGTVVQLSDIKPPKPDGPAVAVAPVKPADPVENSTPLKIRSSANRPKLSRTSRPQAHLKRNRKQAQEALPGRILQRVAAKIQAR